MTREEAIQCIKHELLITVNRKDLTGQAIGEALDMAIDALQDRPTGTWRGELKMPDMPRYEWYRCSECNFLSQSVVNYCPNCGLRMKR